MATRGGNNNAPLHSARRIKNDEFYTLLPDIEKELQNYREQFREKTIFCNCDDPYRSNFFKYFVLNFHSLGLRKLMAACYAGMPIVHANESLLVDKPAERKTDRLPYKIEIVEMGSENRVCREGLLDVEKLLCGTKNTLSTFKGNGDFRSPECIELLKQADVVVTNPPFSLFREFVAILDEHKKKFLIIGNKNAITYKEIFKRIKENKLQTGYMNMGFDIHFIVPDDSEIYSEIRNGIKYARSPSCWFTNLDVAKHQEELPLCKRYAPEEYLHYDQYDAIEVSRVTEIPMDYDGVMGVPISFLDKYNPKQFEIVGSADDKEYYVQLFGYYYGRITCRGKQPFKRLFIKRRH